MVLQQSERERRALGPSPAFGGVAVHLRWDPERGGWCSDRQRPQLPEAAPPPGPAESPPGTGQRSATRPRPPRFVALLGLVLRARALALGSGRAAAAPGAGGAVTTRQGYHGPPINPPVIPVDARPGRT